MYSSDVLEYNVVFSVGDHLAECRSMTLIQVPFPKIRNLVNFAAFSSLRSVWDVTWMSDQSVHLAKL